VTPPNAAEPLVSFEDVHLAYGSTDVLRGVSFNVMPGETKILLGESGAGKTSIMKLAAGLIRPDSGKIRVMDRDIIASTEVELLDFRRHIGFVFQEGALFDAIDVGDNVAFRLNEEHIPEDEVRDRVKEALDFVEMAYAIDRFPAELSGGMRRRVSIARALIGRPPMVFYDSPTAGLDPVTSQTIILLILRLRDLLGVTSVLATHRLQDAFGLSNYHFDGTVGGAVLNSRKNVPPAFSSSPGSGLGSSGGPAIGNRPRPEIGERTGPTIGIRPGPEIGERARPAIGDRPGSGVGERTGPLIGIPPGPETGVRGEPSLGNRPGPEISFRGGPTLGDQPNPQIGTRGEFPGGAEPKPFTRVPGAAAATNLLLLRAGEIYFEGTPEKFLETNDPYLKQFLAAAE
jgi:phospholipid/cholesterol/gamma-HCH transport system ATP-binding protein